MHCHTVYSGDSSLTPLKLIRTARACGMDAVAITEHDSYEASAPADKVAADEGFTLIRGVEVSTDLGHFCLFGVEDDSWDRWPGVHYKPGAEVVETAVAAGLLVIAAHPYSKRDLYAAMDAIYELGTVSAIEAMNGRCRGDDNELAAEAARNMGLPVTGGSDCHSAAEVARCYTVLEREVTDWTGLKAEIEAGRCRAVEKFKPS